MPWQQPVGAQGHGFYIAFPNTAAGAAQARKQFIKFVEHFSLDRELIADVEAVVGEALANASEHGFRPRGTIRVEAWLTEEYLEAAVVDDGPGFMPGPISNEHPPAESPRGYGLFLMQALVDELDFRNDGKMVWFRKHFPNQGSSSSDTTAPSMTKIDAIYSLRDAAEAKAVAEIKADAQPTPAARDTLLEAQMNLESKTQDAVDACYQCGRSHGTEEPHYSDNVLDFKKPTIGNDGLPNDER